MKGLKLRSLSGELCKVGSKYAKNPLDTINDIEKKLSPWDHYILERFGENFSFLKEYYKLPIRIFSEFSFEELCKLHHSSILMMDQSVNEIFERDARYEIMRKIQSSMWRWGMNKGTWNQAVDAYDNIRRFSFIENPDFEIRLDYSTHFNEFGYSKYSRTYIDGVFAYLVYYKRRHVMTIGFSIMEKRSLLIQQVQSVNRTGNRYLYKLPNNRIEFVIGLFRKNFPGYQLYVIDGNCLVEKTISHYKRALNMAMERCRNYRDQIKNPACKSKNITERWLRESEQECEALEAKIVHLKADKSRLALFYGDTGRFLLNPLTLSVNGLIHHQVHYRPQFGLKRKTHHSRLWNLFS